MFMKKVLTDLYVRRLKLIEKNCIYSADHRNKKRKAFIRTFCHGIHGKHGKVKALEVIFSCSSVDSVANGVLLLSLPWIGAVLSLR